MLQRRNVWLSRSDFQVLRSEICGPQEQRFIVCEKDRALRCCFCTGIQTGDELAKGLSKCAQEQQLSAASLKAGAPFLSTFPLTRRVLRSVLHAAGQTVAFSIRRSVTR